jgi:hypothetical protein
LSDDEDVDIGDDENLFSRSEQGSTAHAGEGIDDGDEKGKSAQANKRKLSLHSSKKS